MVTKGVRKFRSGFVAVGTVAATIPTTIASAKMVGMGEDHESFLREVGVWLFRLG
jgi:ribosomal protein L27